MSGQTTVIKSQKTELNQTIEELESALKAKEEVRGVCYARHNCVLRICILFHLNISCFCNYFQELERLKAEVESANEFQSQKDSLSLKLQVSYAMSDNMHVVANAAHHLLPVVQKVFRSFTYITVLIPHCYNTSKNPALNFLIK